MLTATIAFITAFLNLGHIHSLTPKNKIMTEKIFVIIALLIVCAIIVFAICYVFKNK